jgi:hypothetical protein
MNERVQNRHCMLKRRKEESLGDHMEIREGNIVTASPTDQ